MKVECVPLFEEQAGTGFVLHGVTKLRVELGEITVEQGAKVGWMTFPEGTQSMVMTVTEETGNNTWRIYEEE